MMKVAKNSQSKKPDTSGKQPWSARISQADLAKYPGEMEARKRAVGNIKKAKAASRRAIQAMEENKTVYS